MGPLWLGLGNLTPLCLRESRVAAFGSVSIAALTVLQVNELSPIPLCLLSGPFPPGIPRSKLPGQFEKLIFRELHMVSHTKEIINPCYLLTHSHIYLYLTTS